MIPSNLVILEGKGETKATLRVGVVDVGVGRLSVSVRAGGEAPGRDPVPKMGT
jgi:hypothetical protein